MRQLLLSAKGRLNQTIAIHYVLNPFTFTRCVLLSLPLLCLFLFTGCMKQDLKAPIAEANAAGKVLQSEGEFRTYYSGIDRQTLWELQQARAATAKYQRIENAIRDGYEDINVVLPNMGYHYMKTEYVDATFEIRHPEILVYNKMEDGSFQLVAVEYAVPLDLSATAPEGFTGSSDVWTRSTDFGLWLLHAWVWYNNPAGVFSPTNPLVHVD